ncbi:MAG: outer membrane protein assembly factor BamC [Thioploca sp.]|nr:outer membrane protein assembly factor BamC [Thioploca sp.]
MSGLWKVASYCLLLITIVGCSTLDKTIPEPQVDYKKSQTVPSLEIPPDLTISSINDELVIPTVDDNQSTTLSEYDNKPTTGQGVSARNQAKVLPLAKQIQIKHDSRTRWLVIQEEASVIWPKVKQFWLDNGFTLTKEDPQIGIMETQWAENRADIPQDGIRKFLGKALDMVYSASTRDKFRVRLERGEDPTTTELYLSHRGAEEVAKGDDWVWQNRLADPELETEMLNRLMVFLGVEPEQAHVLTAANQPPPSVSRSELTPATTGAVNLILREDFEPAWRHIGLALDRLGFTVEDRDKDSSTYSIRYIDPEISEKSSFWDKLFGDKSEAASQEYFINLLQEADFTRVVVKNNQGQLITSKTAERILGLLHEQLQ